MTLRTDLDTKKTELRDREKLFEVISQYQVLVGELQRVNNIIDKYNFANYPTRIRDTLNTIKTKTNKLQSDLDTTNINLILGI